ncbi:MAG: hypothetical protein JW786_08260 [Desulfobacterales bacterium]|nr:hypothetical protein [Desulfobacterales bacterium]
MSLLKEKKFQILSFALAALILTLTLTLILIFYFVFRAGDIGKKELPKDNFSEKSPESFTFFDLDSNTKFNDEIRENLNRQLGSDAIEYWSPIDLKFNSKDFLKRYFNQLYELDKKLNPAEGVRFEHDTIKLTYRYARKKDVPFDYVMLIFSNFTYKPLMFEIRFQKEGAYVVDIIKGKYGEPQIIDWDTDEGKSLYWEINKDMLIISRFANRFGDPEYQVMIYYVNNMEKLISMEDQERRRKEEEKRRAGQTAF